MPRRHDPMLTNPAGSPRGVQSHARRSAGLRLPPTQEQPEAGVLVELGVLLRIQELLEEPLEIRMRVLEGQHHDGVAADPDTLVLANAFENIEPWTPELPHLSRDFR